MKILASAQENSINCAIKEVREKFNVLKVEKLSKGVFVFEIDEEFSGFRPIFVRYLLPISVEKEFAEVNLSDLFGNLSRDDVFVFHLSALDESVSKDNVLADCLKYFRENNIKINPKEASKIIGLVIFQSKVYFGVSKIKESLSSWPLGECRFKYEEEQVSRAEFKLLEALEYFNIDLSGYKNALDLGASPGGWSRVLLNKGMNVVAVDPAELDESLIENKNLYHFRGLSQDFFRRNKSKFDIVVNDMKMDTKKSIQITEEAMRYLNKNGVVIMTLKLNPNREFEEVKECMKIISEKYIVVGVHQLFHNRSEATVVFKN